MIISTWNCRGACAKTFPRLLRDIVVKYGINALALLETRVSGNKADRIVRKLGFNNWLRVEATGYAGGLWLLWNEWELDVMHIYSDTQILHCRLCDKNSGASTLVSFIYGEPNPQFREGLWNSLRMLARNVEGPRLVLGDFNTYLRAADKLGGAPPKPHLMRRFGNCVSDCDLLELPVMGERFTWEKK